MIIPDLNEKRKEYSMKMWNSKKEVREEQVGTMILIIGMWCGFMLMFPLWCVQKAPSLWWTFIPTAVIIGGVVKYACVIHRKHPYVLVMKKEQYERLFPD